MSEEDEVVILNTGSGLVYPGTVEVDAPVLAASGRLSLPESR